MTTMMRTEPLPGEHQRRVVFGWGDYPRAAYDRWTIAVHEAGHAVVAQVLGIPAAGAYVGEVGGGFAMHPGGLQEPKTGPIDDAGILVEIDLMICGRAGLAADCDLSINLATMLFAGRQAELLHLGLPWLGQCTMTTSDSLRAAEHLRKAGQPATEGYCQKRARSILTAHWDQVAAIADRIMQHGICRM